ncbi:AsmA family protein [Cribrihabitans pelagius]|uniref:AsmA family protein n=1 Tax=Cribrihabitans pelagius TaxID=1765746 RepID=UPI003B59F933
MKLITRVIAAVVLTVTVLAGLLLLLPGERIAQLAAARLEAQTGRTLTFGGDVELSFWPVLGIKADAVSLSNAEWAGSEPFLRAERLTIAMEPAALLRGDVRITGLSAILPHLNLQTRENGTGNWQFGSAAGKATGQDTDQDPGQGADAGGAARPVLIENMELTGASLRYAAHGKPPVTLDNIDLTLDWPDRDQAAQARLTLRPAGAPVRVNAAVQDFASFLSGATAPLDATLTAPGGTLRFFGTAAIDGAAQGRLTADTADAVAFARVLGVPAARLPEDVSLPATLSSEATFHSGGLLALRDLRTEVAGNRLTGAADIEPGAVPRITARLNGGALDVSDLLLRLTGQGSAQDEGAAPSGSGARLARGWPETPIDAGFLALADGTLDLSFESLDTGGVTLGASRLTLTNERARAVLQLQPAAAFGGKLRGELVLNNRSGLSAGGNLAFENIRLERALGELLGVGNLSSLADGELEFLGSGASVAEIMHTLSGKGRVAAGRGFFSGFDLEELMRSGRGNGGSTLFDSLSASFTIKYGVLRNSDLVMRLKQLSIFGAGQVGLGARTLNYTFTPALERAGVRLLTIPVRVTGPWHDPEIRPDLARATAPEFDELKDVIEEKAKDKLRRKLNEELRLELPSGPANAGPSAPLAIPGQAPAASAPPVQDLNRILKERIEQEAREQLQRLLGGN